MPSAQGAPEPAAFSAEVRAKLAELEERSRQHEHNHRPDNTKDGYAADWRQWEAFCVLLQLPVTAITPGSLTAFVEWLWHQPGWKEGTLMAPTTIDRRLSGVVVTGRTRHRLTLDKTVAARARRVLKAKVKARDQQPELGPRRGRGQAPALLVDHLRQVAGAVPDSLLGLRDKAIGTMAFAAMAREHEIAFLRLGGVTAHEHGLLVDLRVSKVKPRVAKVPRGTRPSTCPVRAWHAWTKAAGLDGPDADPDSFAFRRLHPRWHTVLAPGLTPETIGDVITRLGAWAELDFRPTGHSARRGGATSAKRAGADRKAIAAQGGWTDNSTAMEGYFEEVDGWEDNAMNGVL
ncbi:integrase [Streptomyces silvensis]|uniref:Integrase n=1 Tax=Streptomyces silvensis TaxID=1765722 RepID=A0A0W7X3R4_9ACTN|nr:integrase [Streptomyces silvensis]